MKSDEEFIAGIYRKAEERKVEEVKDDAGKKPHFRAWSALAAAACLCLVISGAVYAGSGQKQKDNDTTGKDAVMALSFEEPGISLASGEFADDESTRVRMDVELDGTKPGNTDTYQNSRIGMPRADGEGQQRKNAAVDGFFAGAELALSVSPKTDDT